MQHYAYLSVVPDTSAGGTCSDEAAATDWPMVTVYGYVLFVGQSLTQPPGAPVAVSAAAAGGAVMQSGLPAGSPLTPGTSRPSKFELQTDVSVGLCVCHSHHTTTVCP